MYRKDGIKKSGVGCGHGEDCISKTIHLVIDCSGYPTNVSIISQIPRRNVREEVA